MNPDAHDRRADWLEVVEVLLVLVAAVAYVYIIGWLITWVRLAAARVPVEASLPMIDNQVVFLAGLRLVVIMAIVFAAMCFVAYAVHTGTWQRTGAQWHSVIKHGRPTAAERHRDRPATDYDAPVGDRFVRVIAGFDVGVIAATFGLAAARVLKTPIDQAWPPGPWWDLLLPWVVVTAILAAGLAWLGPLWGNRWLHAALWVVVVVVALVSSAPVGVLLLTWGGVASLGRQYGKVRSRQGRAVVATTHPRHLSFVLSPLPWMLLTVYALVGVAYYGLPPVTFSQATVTTPTGVRIGGYLARNSTGLYLVACTPLADATSTNERVAVIPAADIKTMTTSTTPFVVDSGLRPSLPTVLPAHIRHRREHAGLDPAGGALDPRHLRRGPAASRQCRVPGAPSRRRRERRAGSGRRAGRRGRGAHRADQPQGIAALARRYQPTVLVTAADPFWPVSVGALLADRGPNGQVTCLEHLPAMVCPAKAPRPAPTMADLGQPGSGPDNSLSIRSRRRSIRIPPASSPRSCAVNRRAPAECPRCDRGSPTPVCSTRGRRLRCISTTRATPTPPPGRPPTGRSPAS